MDIQSHDEQRQTALGIFFVSAGECWLHFQNSNSGQKTPDLDADSYIPSKSNSLTLFAIHTHEAF